VPPRLDIFPIDDINLKNSFDDRYHATIDFIHLWAMLDTQSPSVTMELQPSDDVRNLLTEGGTIFSQAMGMEMGQPFFGRFQTLTSTLKKSGRPKKKCPFDSKKGVEWRQSRSFSSVRSVIFSVSLHFRRLLLPSTFQ